MRKRVLVIGAFMTAITSVSMADDLRLWVAVDGIQRHTCPSVSCGVTGRFFFRESLFIRESLDGWARVSPYKSAGCYEGRSTYVQNGQDSCSAANGIVQGEFAEWVRSDFLAAERPDAPVAASTLDAHG